MVFTPNIVQKGDAMKVSNMTTSGGRVAANQFLITNTTIEIDGTWYDGDMFQSYNSNIAFKVYDSDTVFLDSYYWDYSRTTGKYRNQFLGECVAETRDKIKSGEYVLTDLNG